MSDPTLTSATRWRIAAASIAVHLCIGSVYAYSVFVTPLGRLNHWSKPEVTWAFSIAIASLGLSAAVGGKWMARLGPRRSGMIAAMCFGVGLIGAGFACQSQSLWFFRGFYGLLMGVGLGFGYAPPVSALIKWFPDRRGLATGMAVCGFGAGMLLAGVVAPPLIKWIDVPATMWVLGAVYACIIFTAAQVMRTPPANYRPAGWNPAELSGTRVRAGREYELGEALASPQFWLLWGLFFVNICAGITLISLASPMAQEVVGLSEAQAGALVAVMGIFNSAGRIGWASASDYLGRIATFATMLIVQIALFLLLPRLGTAAGFCAAFCIIMTCYGGGFATCPAFIADVFGSRRAGEIYGMILTAWGAAAICGPMLSALLREKTSSYIASLYCTSAGLAVALGFTLAISRLLRRPATRGVLLNEDHPTVAKTSWAT